MSFGDPQALLALLLVPALVALVLAAGRRRARYPLAYTNLALLAGVAAERRRPLRRYVPLVLAALALAAAATAVAQPRTRTSVPNQGATIVLLVDVSGSMRANDVEPSRLAAALAAMNTFLERLPPQVRVGLVAFSDTAQPLVAPTLDRTLVREQVNYLTPEAGTALGDGLAAAVQMVESSLHAEGYVRTPGQYVPAAIVLLSDGAQNTGIDSPQQAAEQARRDGIRVDGVAFGTPNGTVSFGYGPYMNMVPVPPDPAVIHQIAQITGGHAYSAQSAASVADVYRTLGSSIGRSSKTIAIASWFAAAAAVCLLGAVLCGRLLDSPLG